MIERWLYQILIGMAIPLTASFFSPCAASPDGIWIVLTGIGYALFLESYRIWMQSLRKGQQWITGGCLALIALVIFSHFTLERFLLLIALGVPMVRLTRSLRQYSLALDHFKQRLAEENEDPSTTGKC